VNTKETCKGGLKMQEVRCSHFGTADCPFVARGEDAGEVVDKILAHLKNEHKMHVPSRDTVLRTDLQGHTIVDDLAKALGGGLDEGQLLIVKRLRDALDIGTEIERERLR
jgi:predicted small metal-binding protein